MTTQQQREPWLTPGVRGIGAASLLADAGHEIPTALMPGFLTTTLGASAATVGVIEGVSDGLAGAARLAGGALAGDPQRRRATGVGGYTATAVMSGLIGTASSAWQVAVLRAGAWTARGLRVPARNALLADSLAPAVYGRAYGFERAMDNLGAVIGPLLALALVGLVGVRTAIVLSVVPGQQLLRPLLLYRRRRARRLRRPHRTRARARHAAAERARRAGRAKRLLQADRPDLHRQRRQPGRARGGRVRGGRDPAASRPARRRVEGLRAGRAAAQPGRLALGVCIPRAPRSSLGA